MSLVGQCRNLLTPPLKLHLNCAFSSLFYDYYFSSCIISFTNPTANCVREHVLHVGLYERSVNDRAVIIENYEIINQRDLCPSDCITHTQTISCVTIAGAILLYLKL